MSLGTIAQAALEVLIDHADETIAYSGTNYGCVASQVSEGSTVTIGGMEQDLAMSFEFIPAATPTPGERVTYNGTTYRIATVRKNATSDNVTILCTGIDR